MKVITINSCKGGVGKTTTAILMLEYLSTKGKCLAIDTDVINHSLSFYYNKGHDIETIQEKNIFNAFVSDDLKSNIININERIDLIHSDIRLSDYRNLPTFTKVKRLLDTVKSDYDYVIIDTSPTFDNLIVNVLWTSDYLFIPTLLDGFSHQAVLFLMNKIKELELSKLDINILFNQYEKPRTKNPNAIRNQTINLFKKDKTIKDFILKHTLSKKSDYKNLLFNQKLPQEEIQRITKTTIHA